LIDVSQLYANALHRRKVPEIMLVVHMMMIKMGTYAEIRKALVDPKMQR
jgi:hypothetical protein